MQIGSRFAILWHLVTVSNVDSQHAKRPSGLMGRRELGTRRAMDHTKSLICKHARKMIPKMINVTVNALLWQSYQQTLTFVCMPFFCVWVYVSGVWYFADISQ